VFSVMAADPLEQLAGCVSYEVYQLQRCIELIESGVGRELSDANLAEAVKTALVESVDVHARALNDFLALTRTRNSQPEVFATDFDPRWRPRQVLTERQREAIDKRLGPITMQSTRGSEDIEVDPFLAVLRAFGDFLDGLGTREPTRQTWFKVEPDTI
jgi:hypothetical protein